MIIDIKTSFCPICKKPAMKPYSPFCSHRCGQIDLGKWFNEDYRAPTDVYESDATDQDFDAPE